MKVYRKLQNPIQLAKEDKATGELKDLEDDEFLFDYTNHNNFVMAEENQCSN